MGLSVCKKSSRSTGQLISRAVSQKTRGLGSFHEKSLHHPGLHSLTLFTIRLLILYVLTYTGQQQSGVGTNHAIRASCVCCSSGWHKAGTVRLLPHMLSREKQHRHHRRPRSRKIRFMKRSILHHLARPSSADSANSHHTKTVDRRQAGRQDLHCSVDATSGPVMACRRLGTKCASSLTSLIARHHRRHLAKVDEPQEAKPVDSV